MNEVDWKDAAIRAIKTFVQVAIPLCAAIPSLVTAGDFEAVPAVLASAGLAGASAVIAFVWNVLLDWTRE